MDFDPSEAQTDLATLTRTILDGHADRRAATDDPFDRTLWTDLARAGVLAATLPAAAGGDGHGLLEQCAILVELGRALAPVPYLDSIVGSASTVARFGREDQVREFAGAAGRGELILTAALGARWTRSVAPSSGPEAESLGLEPVTAERDGDRWRLTGSRTAVPAASIAGLILVPADLPAAGTTAVFLVDPAGPGVTLAPQQVAGSPGCARLELDGAAVADAAVLGPIDRGSEVAGWLLDRATVGVCATQLGVCERALELTAGYARTREQFGRAIGSFQAVAGRLADAYIDVEAIRVTLWQAAWRLSAGLPAPIEVATAKFWAADGGHRVAHTTVHVHGGVGIDLAHPVHRYFLAATYLEFRLGTATAQLLALGRELATLTD